MLKSTLKIALVVCLFSSIAFADGDMTNGGKTCTTGCGFADDGDMTNGGLVVTDQTQKDSILIFVQKYLYSIFG